VLRLNSELVPDIGAARYRGWVQLVRYRLCPDAPAGLSTTTNRLTTE
jgi:hypothetical protein